MIRPRSWSALWCAVVLAPLAGCGEGSRQDLVVLAATSLTEVMAVIEADFEAAHPSVDVVVSLGPSSALAAQAVAGAPADVLISAGRTPVDDLARAGLVLDEATVVALNSPVLVVPAGNPGNVSGLADLAEATDQGLLVGLCAPQVPCGAAAVELLTRNGVSAVGSTVERDARAVLTKVRLGELDAGIVFLTDAQAAGSAVQIVEVPASTDVVSEYPAVVLADAPQQALARSFVQDLQGPGARQAFGDAGFGLP